MWYISIYLRIYRYTKTFRGISRCDSSSPWFRIPYLLRRLPPRQHDGTTPSFDIKEIPSLQDIDSAKFQIRSVMLCTDLKMKIYIYIEGERERECIRARMHAYTSCNFAAWKYLRNFGIPPCGTFGQKGDRQPNKAPGRRTPDAQSPTGHPPTRRTPDSTKHPPTRQKAHSRLNRQRHKGSIGEARCLAGVKDDNGKILLRKAMRGEDDYVTMYLWPRNIPLLSLATAG